MWKWLGGIVVLVAAAFFCVGFLGDDVQTSYRVHKVLPGETLNGIAAMYYGQNSKGYIDRENYAMMVRVENRNLYNMDRQLQVGDLVRVPVYKVK